MKGLGGDLLDRVAPHEPAVEALAPGAVLLRGFAADEAAELIAEG